MADHRIATIYLSTAGTGHNKDSHGTFAEYPELQAELDSGWRISEIRELGAGMGGTSDINAWLLVHLERADAGSDLRRQRLVSLFLTPRVFGMRQKDDAGRYDTYPALDAVLSEGWEPVTKSVFGFPKWGGTSQAAGWLVMVLERL